jgi:branched-chain amino acid transport system substrate-binding protein
MREGTSAGRRRWTIVSLAAAALAATVLVGGSAASTSASSATKLPPITLGIGLTVIPGIYDSKAQMIPGIQAAIGYARDHGGWGGRGLKLDICITPADPASDTKCFNQFVSDHVDATLGLVGGNATIGLPLEAKNGIASFIQALSSVELSSPSENSFSPGTVGAFKLPARYACAKGYKRVSYLNDAVAQQTTAVQAGSVILKSCGISVNEVAVPQGTPDLAPYVQKAISTNPDLLIAAPTKPAQTIVDTIAAAGFPISKTMMLPAFSQAFLADPKAAGVLVMSSSEGGPPVAANTSPQVKAFLTYMAKDAPTADPLGQLTFSAFQNTIAIWQAGQKIGWKNFNGRTLQKFMNSPAGSKLTIFAGGPVNLTPGLPGSKNAYYDVLRYTGKTFTDLGWWNGLTTCSSQATCAAGVKHF